MAHFIELHIKNNGNPIYINTNAIAYIERDKEHVYVNFLNQRLSSSNNGNSISSASSYFYREEVKESYDHIKLLIEE